MDIIHVHGARDEQGGNHSLNFCTDITKLVIITVLQSISGYYRILQDITRYYNVLQGITGFYRVLQGITGF